MAAPANEEEESWLSSLVGRDFWNNLNCCQPIPGQATGAPPSLHVFAKEAKQHAVRSWAQKNSVAGVGINFHKMEGSKGGLEVASTVLGGPAWCSKQIEPGDVLVKIGDVEVSSMDSRQLAPYILGKDGSDVALTFVRKADKKLKTVSLVRSCGDGTRLGVPRLDPKGGAAPEGPGPKLAGIGIYFEEVTRGGVTECVVASLAEGGSAAASGQVVPGDIVVKIGDTEVHGQSGEVLGRLILGPEGTMVRLTFRDAAGRAKVVPLARGTRFVRKEAFGLVQ
jgi:C-terminal processing protease CtpA/Prc